MTATFHDTGVAFTLPLRERAGGSALLAASGFDAVITASLSRLGHGYLALAEAGYPVLLADLKIQIDPGGWDDPMVRMLSGLADK